MVFLFCFTTGPMIWDIWYGKAGVRWLFSPIGRLATRDVCCLRRIGGGEALGLQDSKFGGGE
jgi:hypothetical protein